MNNNFIFKSISFPLSRKGSERYLKYQNNSGFYEKNNFQRGNIQSSNFQKQKIQSFDESFQKQNLFLISNHEICTNNHESKIYLLNECQLYIQDIMISKKISIRLQISKSNKHDLMRVRMIKEGQVEDVKISEEQRKYLCQLANTKKYRLCQYQLIKQINKFLKNILDNNQLLGGGGCCSSGAQNNDLNLTIAHKDNESILKNKEFEKKYKILADQETIIQSIVHNNQLKIQNNLLDQCIVQQLSQNEEYINAYKLEIQDIFEIYLMLETTRSSFKSERKQEEFEKILEEVETIQDYEQDFPLMELMFYANILANLNKINYRFDQNSQNEIKEFMNKILNFKKNKGKFSEIVSSVSDIRKQINQVYKKKELYALKFSLEIWIKKIDEFGEKFILEDVSSEILFYVKIFFEINKLENQQDEIILILIRINYLLEKFLKEKSKSDIQIYSQFSNNLMKEKIDEFLCQLMQKSDLFINKLFLAFSVENQNYRYITLSILINMNSIFTFANQNTQNQEYLLDFLSNKYLIEKELTIRVLFERSNDFVQYFEKNIKNEMFKERIINFDKQRKLKLLPYIQNINDHERSINSFDDIIKMISDNAIERWERDIKKRQRQNLAQKDDVLLEVKDLYINQMITYQKGNPIFLKAKKNSDAEEYISLEQNALLDIIQLFLNPNYSYRIKSLNNNNSGENENEQIFKEQSNKCQILGILAEGGTGKSMLMKKIETFLIEKLSKLNTETGTGNYLPLLIKCNSLDSKNPSLDDYLKKYGGINENQIQNLKQNDRNKLILLDGYDEYTGDYFAIYKKLNLNQWKNTKVIVATRKEKLSEEDAITYFSKQNENGEIDQMSYSLVKLEEFTANDIYEYAQRYFKQERKTEQIDKDLKILRDCLQNIELEKLLHLPINLYLFTRLLVHLSEKEVLNLKSKVSDQIGIQEMFFNDQFEREAQSFIDAHVNSDELKKNNEFKKSLKNSYFEYFQSLAMKMFENRGVKSNYLQLEKDHISFNIQQPVIHGLLKKDLLNTLLDKIKSYINSKIVTRAKEETTINQENQELKNIKNLIEFKHKSLFEYFAARAMKYDFDAHGDNIYKLSIEQLKDFNINIKSIMNIGENQSEQQILIKLYKMIKSEIQSDEFYKNYHVEEIEKNSRYIQYIKKSSIKKSTEISKIDIGASNMLSAIFLSRFTFSKLQLRYCSFSKLYVSREKSDQISFDYCNLQNSFLKNLNINYDSCYTQFANFDSYQKLFDTSNIYSFNQIIWDKKNILYSITQQGFINAFKIENQNKIVLQRSKQLSQTPLNKILASNSDTLLVSSQNSLLQINSVSFEILQIYKFKNEIKSIVSAKENILVLFKNENIFNGSFTIGFRNTNMTGSGCVYNESKQILLTYSGGNFSLYKAQVNIKYINKIQGHSKDIFSVAFSENGKYLATGSEDETCKIWNAEKGFELINTIQGHTYYINSVIFSADGKYLATGSSDKTCKIWNVEKDFELINTIQGHESKIHSVAFSEDIKYLATCSDDNTCKIWDVEKVFEVVNTIQGNTYDISSVAFSPDGKYLATGSKDCKIWNAEKGFELTNTLSGHTYLIRSVAFSADGKYLATGSSDQTCKIWNVEKDFELINTIQGHTSFIYSVAFSTDGKYLATGSQDSTCKIWNAEKGFELINTIQGHKYGIKSVAFSADGKYLATGSEDKTFKIWNAEKGFELINTIQGHKYKINSVTFSADGKYLATGSSDDTCKIWNVEKSFELINTIKGHTEEINSVVFSADGKYLATSSSDKTNKIWNTEKGFELINTIQGHNSKIDSVAFSADGKYLATGSEDKTCKIWNAEKGFEIINLIQGHISYINSVSFTTDGKYLATSSSDNTCKLWNTEQGFELIKTIQDHSKAILSIAFSIDGKYLATGSDDKTCKIWNVEKGFELIITIQGHKNGIASVTFSTDGKYLSTGSIDHTCKLWNAQKGFELLNTIEGHNETIYSLTFSVDGKYLATGSMDKTCKIWNAEKGFELINTILGHSSYIISVAFSANRKYLVTGSQDKTCKIWNTEKGFELINTIQSHTSYIHSVAFSADGKYLVTSSHDKTCKIWNAEKSFEFIYTIQGYNYGITSIAFSADRKYLAIGYEDKTCKIWNSEQGFKLLNTIQNHESYINPFAFSADGKYLATGSKDNTCKIWNAEKSFELINIIQGHTSNINSVTFSVDGKYLATGSSDKTCKIWNAEQRFELINTIQVHIDPIFSIAFSADGKNICIEQNDKLYYIYDLQDFKIIEKQVKYEIILEKYLLEQNQDVQLDKMKIFENIFIL